MSGLRLSVVSLASGLLLAIVVVAAYGYTRTASLAAGAPQQPGPSPTVSKAMIQCGGLHNDLVAELDLPSGHDFWSVFPEALKAPELDSDRGPIHLVVFRGPFKTDGLAIGGAAGSDPSQFNDVVCVIHSDGSMVLYANVSRVGSEFAP